ncbi:hypothetical protein NT6N_21860 [Oceaniferula spumae]|uniref:Tetratricopeptide repeat protein n=1 Tax=Oceaniferula spumae TaxID=2979115 RepID=A0AAT9FMD3_9BACT
MSKPENTNTQAEGILRSTLSKDADNWDTRKKLAHLLYNDGKSAEAAVVVWEAPAIPSIDLELGFAIKVLAKGAPRKAIRLLSSIQTVNKDKPAQNLGLANALMHYGMVMEAARFYGAAVAQSSDLASADLEHFLLWTDDREKIWGDFKEEKPKLGELPWMKRDAKEAAQLEKTMKGHTTPVKIPDLKEVDAEKIVHDMYVQSSRKGAEATPPPAVSIPIGRVNPKDVIVDPERGAATAPATSGDQTEAKPTTATPVTPVSKPGLPQSKPVLPQAKPVLPGSKPNLPETAADKPTVTSLKKDSDDKGPKIAKPTSTSSPTPVNQPKKPNLSPDGKIVLNRPNQDKKDEK